MMNSLIEDVNSPNTESDCKPEDDSSTFDDSIENDCPSSLYDENPDSGGYLVLTFDSNSSTKPEANVNLATKPGVASTRFTSACLSKARNSSPETVSQSKYANRVSPTQKRTIQILSCSGTKNQAQVELLNGQKVVRIVRTSTSSQTALQPKFDNIKPILPLKIKDVTSVLPHDQSLSLNTNLSIASSSSPSSQVGTPQGCNDPTTYDSGCEPDSESYISLSSDPMPFNNGPTFTKTARMLKCNECQKYYRNQYSLRHHICLKRKDVWRKGDVPTRLIDGKLVYYCPTCMKPFRWLGNLTRHFYVHTGQRFFKCEMCNKEFFSAYQVRRHMNSHTGLRFKCEICAKPFTCKYACAWHTRQHYNPERAAMLVPRR